MSTAQPGPEFILDAGYAIANVHDTVSRMVLLAEQKADSPVDLSDVQSVKPFVDRGEDVFFDVLRSIHASDPELAGTVMKLGRLYTRAIAQRAAERLDMPERDSTGIADDLSTILETRYKHESSGRAQVPLEVLRFSSCIGQANLGDSVLIGGGSEFFRHYSLSTRGQVTIMIMLGYFCLIYIMMSLTQNMCGSEASSFRDKNIVGQLWAVAPGWGDALGGVASLFGNNDAANAVKAFGDLASHRAQRPDTCKWDPENPMSAQSAASVIDDVAFVSLSGYMIESALATVSGTLGPHIMGFLFRDDTREVDTYDPRVQPFGEEEDEEEEEEEEEEGQRRLTGPEGKKETDGMIRTCMMCSEPAPRRCSQCKIAHYCSVACQDTDWYGGHMDACSA